LAILLIVVCILTIALPKENTIVMHWYI